MHKYIIIGLCFLLAGCTAQPVMEPQSQVLVSDEDLDTCTVTEVCKFTQDQAFEIAKQSTCAEEGQIKDTCTCNENSGTYWFEMEVEGHEGCAPACVVESETGNAEVNWRCTGLISPEE